MKLCLKVVCSWKNMHWCRGKSTTPLTSIYVMIIACMSSIRVKGATELLQEKSYVTMRHSDI